MRGAPARSFGAHEESCRRARALQRAPLRCGRGKLEPPGSPTRAILAAPHGRMRVASGPAGRAPRGRRSRPPACPAIWLRGQEKRPRMARGALHGSLWATCERRRPSPHPVCSSPMPPSKPQIVWACASLFSPACHQAFIVGEMKGWPGAGPRAMAMQQGAGGGTSMAVTGRRCP